MKTPAVLFVYRLFNRNCHINLQCIGNVYILCNIVSECEQYNYHRVYEIPRAFDDFKMVVTIKFPPIWLESVDNKSRKRYTTAKHKSQRNPVWICLYKSTQRSGYPHQKITILDLVQIWITCVNKYTCHMHYRTCFKTDTPYAHKLTNIDHHVSDNRRVRRQQQIDTSYNATDEYDTLVVSNSGD